MPTTELRVLREKDRFRLTGLSRVQAWRLEREGLFPKRIQLGVNSVGWIASELDAWIVAKASARD
jgi:predicted DNA-binding transcriptional regulator AlpA